MKTYRVLGQKVVRTAIEVEVDAVDLDDAYEQAHNMGIEVDRIDAWDDLVKTMKEKLDERT